MNIQHIATYLNRSKPDPNPNANPNSNPKHKAYLRVKGSLGGEQPVVKLCNTVGGWAFRSNGRHVSTSDSLLCLTLTLTLTLTRNPNCSILVPMSLYEASNEMDGRFTNPNPNPNPNSNPLYEASNEMDGRFLPKEIILTLTLTLTLIGWEVSTKRDHHRG